MKRGLEEGGAPYKPLPPERLYLTSGEWEQRLEKRPTGQLYPFDAPGGPNITVVDLGGRPGRDFAPERAQAAQAAEPREASKVGVYDALGGHLPTQAQAGRPLRFAAYSTGHRTSGGEGTNEYVRLRSGGRR